MLKNPLRSVLPRVRWLALAWLLVGALAGAPAWAQGPITDDEVNQVAKQLFCPVCENIPLDVCPTQACAQWRGIIRAKLEAGWSDQAIQDYFVQQYGERVLAQPSTRGINILIWVIPPILVAGGGVFLWQFLQRNTAAGRTLSAGSPAVPSTPQGESSSDDEYIARLEEELARRC